MLPAMRTLPNANVHIATVDGIPVRGTKSRSDGTLGPMELIDVSPGEAVVVTAVAEGEAQAHAATTVAL